MAEERQALKDELRDIRAAMLGRQEIEPCFVNRLAEVKEILRRHDAGLPLGIVGLLGRPLYPPTEAEVWRIAIADQSLSHMSLAEKRRFIHAYDWVDIYRGITADERTAWRSLQVLNHAQALQPSDWSQVRKDYEQAVETHWILATGIRA